MKDKSKNERVQRRKRTGRKDDVKFLVPDKPNIVIKTLL